MSDTVISVENLSKRYILGHQRSKSDGFRHVIEDAVRAPLRWLRNRADQRGEEQEEFWALRDLSFEINQGEVVGFIGRNGAGKSTLLKVLSRITEPTHGRIQINGRVASLLEVGTGFHPELTGRENIFLNGAILGMSRVEINRKFDEIVAFSEVEKFLDTPVKRYSSGMYVRLAFAVAAHLEPEILIVDEVLAVGDAQFQAKCMGKMQDVASAGRTILFVSHNMNAITKLCTRAVVLKSGRLAYIGDVQSALPHYGASTEVSSKADFHAKGSNSFLRSMEILCENSPSDGILKPLSQVAFEFMLVAQRRLNQPRLAAAFTNMKGDRVFAVGSWLGPTPLPPLAENQRVRLTFTMPPIVPGKYTLDVGFYDKEAGVAEDYHSACAVEVAETNYLQMIETYTPELGQLYVRSEISIVPEMNSAGSECR